MTYPVHLSNSLHLTTMKVAMPGRPSIEETNVKNVQGPEDSEDGEKPVVFLNNLRPAHAEARNTSDVFYVNRAHQQGNPANSVKDILGSSSLTLVNEEVDRSEKKKDKETKDDHVDKDGLPGDRHAKNTKQQNVNKSENVIVESEPLLEKSEVCAEALKAQEEEKRPSLKRSLVAFWQSPSKKKYIRLTLGVVALLAIVISLAVYFGQTDHQSDEQPGAVNNSRENPFGCRRRSPDLKEICENMTTINVFYSEYFGNDYQNCSATQNKRQLSLNEFWSCVPQKKDDNACEWFLTKTTKDPSKQSCKNCCPIITFEGVEGLIIKYAPHDLLQCNQREEKTAVHCFSSGS